ncbi:hypothetical protein HELRODRAFT_194514 [Helobdella robusta]|uniref:Apple domain-containing protein n=1 Tax=Helobdella robusta TaxID=6412 RepID=T1FW52_HELRO|nr:hypothetical protein HELRODRAFT_194514 [Helobdella robusta]ESN91178.1 hypothetical protein HELRODRAFT_194514 [Helobdella robusta]
MQAPTHRTGRHATMLPNQQTASCRTSSPFANVLWLLVDLAADYFIDSVTILTTLYQCEFVLFNSKMNKFVTGATDRNATPVRGEYFLCGQYQTPLPSAGYYATKCNANLPALRYVIVQQVALGYTYLQVCELFVYAAENSASKFWYKLRNYRLLHAPLESSTNRSSINSCILDCVMVACDFINYNETTNACEMLVHPFGYPGLDGNIMTPALGWNYWQLLYA